MIGQAVSPPFYTSTSSFLKQGRRQSDSGNSLQSPYLDVVAQHYVEGGGSTTGP